ncbi:MAG: hypothetical protein IPM70_14155 [Proteobacteria bacterium]|nr:hypothetical protein [Pseudomonadota bacterium]
MPTRLSAVRAIRTWARSVSAVVFDFTGFVNSDLRLRGTYSRDVREATFAERLDEQGLGRRGNDPNATACWNSEG